MARSSAALGVVMLVGLAGCSRPPSPAAVSPSPGTSTAVAGDAGAQPRTERPAEPPAAPPSGLPLEITFDDIKLDMKKGDRFTRDLLPKRVTDLERRAVRIRGYILPSFQQTGIEQFVLVRDNQECCFGPGAALHDCIVVRMRPGKSTSFSIRPVAVAGTFRLDELRGPDGSHLAIYGLDGDEVR
jgi:hypothetical protein